MKLAIILSVFAISASFGLCPSQIAILVNADHPASVSIGTFYALSRDVPQSNIIPLRFGRVNVQDISRKDYIEKVVLPVRDKLGQKDFSSIRCLLTTYMMPYRIQAPVPDSDTLVIVKALEKVLADNQSVMLNAAKQLDPNFKISAADNAEKQAGDVRLLIDKNCKLIKAMPNDGEREKRIAELTGIVMPLYGVFVTAQMLEIEFGQTYEIPPDDFAQAAAAREMVDAAISENYSYAKCLETDYYSYYAKVYGVLELVESLFRSVKEMMGCDVSSAFDSELALVKIPSYNWYKWQPNALRFNINDRSTLMVSRIDGPNEAICRGIIKKSIYAEKHGFRGKVCIDARYFTSEAAGAGYAEYDTSLKKTAMMFASAGWPVVLEETEALIKQHKPIKTVMYCGWYSLNKYVDAFDFCDGAVGYHIASLEARDIRDAGNDQWVSSMLANGITATLGAVEEPYLNAFPMPDRFFAKLLEGKCMAEAFALTNPYNSWRIMLIADPLYTPFRAEKKR